MPTSSPTTCKPVVITMGDAAGIGPEIVVKALSRREALPDRPYLVLGDPAAMRRALEVTGARMELRLVPEGEPLPEPAPGALFLRPVSKLHERDMVFGSPSPAAGDAAFRAICAAAGMCMRGEAAAMATAPINKEAMNRAGHRYPGHTELLAELTGTSDYVMMLAGPALRVTLVTIHEPLSRVPSLLTTERVLSVIRITHDDVARYFRPHPRIAVLSLNPHCGEGGMFGNEEQRVIGPAVAAAREAGMNVTGPHSADTLFHFAVRGDYDAVVCMYHDQGLIPLKLLHFDDGVNITLGLPIIRTSVDHGTAYDLAGTATASEESMLAALRTAVHMAETAGRLPRN